MSAPASPGADEVVRELDELIRARYGLVAVRTSEEQRCLELLHLVHGLERHRAKPLYSWSRVRGLAQLAGPAPVSLPRAVPETEDPVSVLEHIASTETGLYALCDFGPYLNPFGQPDPLVVRRLRELAWTIQAKPVSVFFVGASFPDPPELEKEVKSFDLPLPAAAETAPLLDDYVDRLAALRAARLDVDPATRAQLLQALLGLTQTEQRNALARASVRHGGLGPEALATLLEEKRALIRQTGALTFAPPEAPAHFGGYPALQQILREVRATYSPRARARGVEPAKGILLVGLPGCGKDLFKRVAAASFGRPLLDLQMGAVMGEGGGLLGSAEMSIRRALQIAERAECVLGLSEYEKAVSGLASSGQTDSGTTARVIGTLLAWMADQEGTPVIATANDVRRLAPEQTRQGRFSHVAFVDLPSASDREAIYRVHLARRGQDPARFDLGRLAELSAGFSGAEVEAVVRGGLLDAFMDGERDLTPSDLERRVGTIHPTSEVRRDEVEDLRRWARAAFALDARTGAPAGTGRPGAREVDL